MGPPSIDLNADLGEGYPNDAAILDRVSSTSIACGAHAGDPATMSTTLREAKRRGVVVGAHPGYPDRARFGRREMWLPPAQIRHWIVDQVERLGKFAALVDLELAFVKPHGALYNQAQRQDDVASAVVEALERLNLPLLGQPGTVLEMQAREKDLRYIPEGFPDRRYRDDGSLVPRSQPDAVLQDPAEVEAQVVRLVEQGVRTLCIHGDDPRAVANAETVRTILQRRGIAIRSFV